MLHGILHYILYDLSPSLSLYIYIMLYFILYDLTTYYLLEGVQEHLGFRAWDVGAQSCGAWLRKVLGVRKPEALKP